MLIFIGPFYRPREFCPLLLRTRWCCRYWSLTPSSTDKFPDLILRNFLGRLSTGLSSLGRSNNFSSAFTWTESKDLRMASARMDGFSGVDGGDGRKVKLLVSADDGSVSVLLSTLFLTSAGVIRSANRGESFFIILPALPMTLLPLLLLLFRRRLLPSLDDLALVFSSSSLQTSGCEIYSKKTLLKFLLENVGFALARN